MPASEKKIVAHLFGRWWGGGGGVRSHPSHPPPCLWAWIQPFSVERWRNCWYDRGLRIIFIVRIVFATIVRRNTIRIAARFRHYIFAKIWYARQRAVYIWRNCWAYFKLWVLAQDIPFSFFLEVAFIDKTYLYRNRGQTSVCEPIYK